MERQVVCEGGKDPKSILLYRPTDPISKDPFFRDELYVQPFHVKSVSL
jgi:hypothetical protein